MLFNKKYLKILKMQAKSASQLEYFCLKGWFVSPTIGQNQTWWPDHLTSTFFLVILCKEYLTCMWKVFKLIGRHVFFVQCQCIALSTSRKFHMYIRKKTQETASLWLIQISLYHMLVHLWFLLILHLQAAITFAWRGQHLQPNVYGMWICDPLHHK